MAKYGVNIGYHQRIPKDRISFLFMPFMHSEDLDNQDMSVKLFREFGKKENLYFAEHHRNLIRKFGRFPHRNAILGRTSTQEEIDYLNSEDAFKG